MTPSNSSKFQMDVTFEQMIAYLEVYPEEVDNQKQILEMQVEVLKTIFPFGEIFEEHKDNPQFFAILDTFRANGILEILKPALDFYERTDRLYAQIHRKLYRVFDQAVKESEE